MRFSLKRFLFKGKINNQLMKRKYIYPAIILLVVAVFLLVERCG